MSSRRKVAHNRAMSVAYRPRNVICLIWYGLWVVVAKLTTKPPTMPTQLCTQPLPFFYFFILGGGIYNIIGTRRTLFTGCSTSVLYAGSLLYYNHTHKQGFVIVAGGLLGIGAGLLWAAQVVEGQTEEVIFDHLHATGFQYTSLGFAFQYTPLGRTITREDIQNKSVGGGKHIYRRCTR
ncbi:hypothetical protein OROMI_025003 [Orobanche minor]